MSATPPPPNRCPFCGGKDIYDDDATLPGAETLHFKVCGTCGAEGPCHPDPAEAARRWDCRAPERK